MVFINNLPILSRKCNRSSVVRRGFLSLSQLLRDVAVNRQFLTAPVNTSAKTQCNNYQGQHYTFNNFYNSLSNTSRIYSTFPTISKRSVHHFRAFSSLQIDNNTDDNNDAIDTSSIKVNTERIKEDVDDQYYHPLDPINNWLINPKLKEHIRSSYSLLKMTKPDIDNDNPDSENDTRIKAYYHSLCRETGCHICFLGTGGGQATVERYNTATAIRIENETLLFDAGEGILHQLTKSRFKLGDITKIFITHMHSDHVFGLPGLILSLQNCISSKKVSRKLEIFGPPGLYNYVASITCLSGTEIRYIDIVVNELHGGTRRSEQKICTKQYPEFRHQRLKRRIIRPDNSEQNNNDGWGVGGATWTISTAEEITSPEVASEFNSKPRGLYIKAAEVDHVPSLQCFGYVIEEGHTQPRTLDIEKAMKLGVQSQKKYSQLKSGFAVMSDTKLMLVEPDQVLVGDAMKPRKITILGDCWHIPDVMRKLSYNSDVLIHEATFLSEDNIVEKVKFHGHCTAYKAGRNATILRAKVLLMNHLGPMAYFKQKSYVEEAILGAIETLLPNEQQTPPLVQMAFDHLEVVVPRSGF